MIKRLSPFLELMKLQEDLNHLVCDLPSHLSGESLHGVGNWIPNVDLGEDAERIIIQVEVPGIHISQLRVTCHGGFVQISGDKKHPVPKGEAHFLCLERSYGKFSRTIHLNAPVDLDGAKAHLQNGILKIVVPKIIDRRKLERVIPVEKID
jgi:HSP20 family protein